MSAAYPGGSKSIVRENAERDPAYRPYCGRCPGLVRMAKVERFYWRCACGAEHDERVADPVVKPYFDHCPDDDPNDGPDDNCRGCVGYYLSGGGPGCAAVWMWPDGTVASHVDVARVVFGETEES